MYISHDLGFLGDAGKNVSLEGRFNRYTDLNSGRGQKASDNDDLQVGLTVDSHGMKKIGGLLANAGRRLTKSIHCLFGHCEE